MRAMTSKPTTVAKSMIAGMTIPSIFSSYRFGPRVFWRQSHNLMQK